MFSNRTNRTNDVTALGNARFGAQRFAPVAADPFGGASARVRYQARIAQLPEATRLALPEVAEPDAAAPIETHGWLTLALCRHCGDEISREGQRFWEHDTTDEVACSPAQVSTHAETAVRMHPRLSSRA